jgi:hypothetical protein
VIEQILESTDKQTGAHVLYEADPLCLVDRLLEVYRTRHDKTPSHFCAEKGPQG